MATDKRTAPENIEFSYYIVGYFDLLSQRDWLHEMEQLPSTPEQKAHFIAAARNTVGAVEHFRGMFQKWCGERPNPLAGLLPHELPKNPATTQDLLTTNIRMRPFSDALMISACVISDKAPKYPRVVDVLTTILAAAGAFFFGFLRKDVFRGGIEIGVGTQLHDTDVYGSVLVSAYRLEDTVAQWPRIVVGDGLVAYLGEAASRDPVDHVFEKVCGLAMVCRKLIDVDADGQFIVDYLGLPMRQFLGTNKAEFESDVKDAYAFISSEHQRFANDGNHKLALRYAILRRYFLDKCGDILEASS
ncbi:MAG: hypothetical protein IID42_14415 [Planctomycetes bacterium]|nr:hypothetical protein [Planctomycetota bacterium]